MSGLKITPIDETLVLNGTWVTYMGVRLKIARQNNEKFRALFRRLSKPYGREIERGTLDEDTATTLMCESMAEAILVDWDASTFPGNIPYSKENAIDLLRNDEDCRSFVTEFSQRAENFYKAELEERKGNSSRPLSGNLNTEKT